MNDELITALDECLQRSEAGVSVETVVQRYPALARNLRPLLQAARAVDRDLPVPRRAQMASRAQFLASAASLRPAAPARRALALLPRALSAALTFVLGFVAGTYGVVAASAQSLPGDQLYGIKRAAEDVQLLLAATQAQPQLEKQFADERIKEVEEVAAHGRAVMVEFEGRLQSVTGSRWVVSGITVIVTTGTRLEGEPALGAAVEVKGASQPDGTVLAHEIEIEGPGLTATATPTPVLSPVPGSTPSATAGPRPTETPERTEEAEVSETPESGDDPEDEDETETDEDEDEDHSGPSPTNTPKP